MDSTHILRLFRSIVNKNMSETIKAGCTNKRFYVILPEKGGVVRIRFLLKDVIHQKENK
jgi:hypothetical protein